MLLYRFLTVLFSPLIFNHLLWKSLRFKQSRFLLQRLGFKLDHVPQKCVWFHCASVGETNTALSLIYELHKRNPSQTFLITTNTTTGAEIVLKQKQSWLFHAYLPMDWVSTTRRFVNRVQPLALYIIETELWPNLVDTFYKKNIPVTIINGRLSKKTTSTNRWIKSVYRRTLEHIEHVYVRSETDRALYLQLGAGENKVSVLGNLKFIPPNIDNVTPQQTTDRDYVVVASSHDSEELQITECWKQLNRDELLVIAPRHPERGEQISKQLAGYNIAMRSKDQPVTEDTQVYLLDTVGELTSWFADAKIIVMAGSFIHRGGHNILEPAHFGKAIIFGPHMESFNDEVEILLSGNAALQASSIDDLKNLLPTLLDSAAAREQLQTNATKTVAPFATILSDYADVVERELKHMDSSLN
jgi:3-deoxy-D-manno-octulosonic-acid transferase